jgi:hypothetical protein
LSNQDTPQTSPARDTAPVTNTVGGQITNSVQTDVVHGTITFGRGGLRIEPTRDTR